MKYIAWLLVMTWCVLATSLTACSGGADDDDAGDDDTDSEVEDCEAGAELSIDLVDPAQGLNVVLNELAVTGGCFDNNVTGRLISDDGEVTLNIAAKSHENLTASIPPGIPVGEYTLELARGELTAAADYVAISNIVVSGAYEGKFFVVDVTDINNPLEVIEGSPFNDFSRFVNDPSVNYDGTRVYFTDEISPSQTGIWIADLVDATNNELLTDNSVPFYRSADACPTGPAAVVMGCAEVVDVCDVYIVAEDGSGQTMLADHNDVVSVNGDNTSSWGLWDPAFSPDGSQVAYIRETVCEGSTEPDCEYDYYSVIMVMNADGSGQQVVYWEPGELSYSGLRWTWDGYLLWQRRQSESDPYEYVMMRPEDTAPFVIQPPGGTWDTEWNIWGEGIDWFVYSPLDDAMLLQPFDTMDLVYFPITIGSGSASGGAGSLLEVPNPEVDGERLSHYMQADWFGWRP